jgi:hypothetical protein
MGNLRKKIWKKVIGGSDARRAGFDRTMQGMREGDRREFYLGLVLSAVAYLQRTKSRKELIHKQSVPSGSAVVIHHKKSGKPRLEIVKPKKRKRS